jgi:adenylylsulfate kinase
MSKNKKYSLFIGRFQPLHLGHDFIVRQALDEGKSVWIAIRDTPITEWDPYTAQERLGMISEHYKDEDVVVTIVPDIESVNIGRKVGYDVNRYDAPEDIEGISATQIRDMISNGDMTWKEKVPKIVADFLISKGDLEIPSEKGIVIWLTGLSGAGKSTISNVLASAIKKVGKPVKILDGDEVRKNLTADLGFSREDRSENIKRISYVAKSIADCNGVAVVAAISPYADDRERARKLVGANRFFEVFVDCHIDTLIERDVKGLYAKALSGEIENFTGISDPYECPEKPDCIVNSGYQTLNESLDIVKKCLNTFLSDVDKEPIMYHI